MFTNNARAHTGKYPSRPNWPTEFNDIFGRKESSPQSSLEILRYSTV